MTILAKLLASEEDTLGYITYVFECLDEDIIKETKYIMCVRYPNWDHRKIEIGEVGFLNFLEIRAGMDKWEALRAISLRIILLLYHFLASSSVREIFLVSIVLIFLFYYL